MSRALTSASEATWRSYRVRSGREPYVRIWKSLLGKIFASLLILVFSWRMALVALLVRTNLGPSVIFRQLRIGLHGAPFVVLKFRTTLPERRRAAMPIGHRGFR
jgi:lipopolysaccharide/colanic/teichoic acid biosynthesis glycosyltransferase